MLIRSIVTFLAAAVLLPASTATAVPDGKGFPTPLAAAQALVRAAKSGDQTAIVNILGPSSRDLVTTHDPVQDQRIRQLFTERAAEKMQLIPNPWQRNAMTLLVGNDGWPLPIPIVQVNGQWYFNTAEGRNEILARRIGRNELDAIQVSRGYVEAQQDYGEHHRNNMGSPIYAQRIISSPGKQDGLYWEGTVNGQESPIGKFIARAFAQGYTTRNEPYHGYYFKVLTAQGPHASGGAKNYVKDGEMTGGFALIAWPSDYRSTGVMTFIVNRAGIVYQKDLGPDTARLAAAYSEYDPDDTWTPVSDATE